jgi:predicted 3-demethylubiquinone-9 3-methyltransferase (glyoxalase superfamily)
MSQKIVPCLWFDSQAEEAANVYISAFVDSRIIHVSHYEEQGARVSGMPDGSVLTVDFELGGQKFVGLNGGPQFHFTPAISFFVSCASVEEVDRLFEILSKDGCILMPLDKYPFSERFAWITDRFGLSWQFHAGNGVQKITPSLMFVQELNGKAVEAINFYTSVFSKSKIGNIVPYEKDEGEKEGSAKHADFSLDGSNFIAMDSGLDHSTFSPAVSFMVECNSQKEIDHFWSKLSFVPEAEQCGWLQDKFGISWQIVPAALATMLKNKDPGKTERVMSALLQMKNLNLKELRRAYEHKGSRTVLNDVGR